MLCWLGSGLLNLWGFVGLICRSLGKKQKVDSPLALLERDSSFQLALATDD